MKNLKMTLCLLLSQRPVDCGQDCLVPPSHLALRLVFIF